MSSGDTIMKLNNTKRAENYRSSYNNARIICLTEAYKNPSILNSAPTPIVLRKCLKWVVTGFGLWVIIRLSLLSAGFTQTPKQALSC